MIEKLLLQSHLSLGKKADRMHHLFSCTCFPLKWLVFAATSLILIASLASATTERSPISRFSRPNLSSRFGLSSTTTTTTTTSTSTTTEKPSEILLNQRSTNASFPSSLSSDQKQTLDFIGDNVALTNSRASRNADIFQNGDGFNIFVTNTCEFESMRVDVRTSRPFFGVIHTKNQRQKSVCAIEGNGNSEYSLDISHVLNPSDDQYCGVIRARRNSPDDKDILSVVIAVRLHKNIELSDDKFFLLNCTNRCRRPDCTRPNRGLAELNNDPSLEVENSDTESIRSSNNSTKNGGEDECTIWKFPWAVGLLWSMAIIIVAMLISHCILCSTFTCKWVKTEVEEKEPSVFEETDYGDSDDNRNHTDKTNNKYKKKYPVKIEYDNKNVYDSNEPYYTTKDSQRKSQSTNYKRKH